MQQKCLAKKKIKSEMKVFVHACVNISTKERRCHMLIRIISCYKIFEGFVVSCMDHELGALRRPIHHTCCIRYCSCQIPLLILRGANFVKP